jgi:hypothetical protein
MVPLPLPPVAARGVGLTRQHELADILVELAHEERVNERHIWAWLHGWLSARRRVCVRVWFRGSVVGGFGWVRAGCCSLTVYAFWAAPTRNARASQAGGGGHTDARNAMDHGWI